MRSLPFPLPRGALAGTARLALALTLGAVACTPADRGIPEPVGAAIALGEPIQGALTPHLATGPDGTVLLSVMQRDDSVTHTLRVTRLDGAAWAPLQDIAQRDFFVNWADFPSILPLRNGELAAHWLEREGAGTYSYGVRVAQTRDGGATWDSAVAPHTDGLLAEHGFVALWDASEDATGNEQAAGVGAVWLDGRKTAMQDSAREMTVRTAVVGRATDGSAVATRLHEALLDARTCDCCQTATARAQSGRVIVYRDRTEDEIRDIAIVRRTATGWTEPRVVHADNWHFEACPVNGPSVAATGDTVVVAWFTGAQDTARVRLAVSTDGGASFAAPHRIDDGDPVGRVTVLLDAQQQPVVLWMERVQSDSTAIRLRRIGYTGAQSAATTVATVASSRRTGFPRMTRDGNALIVAWTVPDETAGGGTTTSVHTARVPLRPR